jgi:exodeoxyribonuclease VII large subunit
MSVTPTKTRDLYTITRLNREVRTLLEGSFPASLWVQGEISNLARPASGHLYFTLKDPSAQVRCAMFRGRNQLLKFNPENGMEVITRAGVSLYEGRGEFQLVIEQMEPAGAGALQKAFEELKQRLYQEGLFNEDHKQQIPVFPGRIGVITSPGGAAIRDIIHVLKRRFPFAQLIIYAVPVQGDGAAERIIHALETAQRRQETEVLILARGGGSLEDLWCFNDEQLARTMFHCSLPIVSGIGHEIDFTIADFVADLRAPTPSAAAELIAPDAAALTARIQGYTGKLSSIMNYHLQRKTRDLVQLEKRLPHPLRILQEINQRVDYSSLRLQQSLKMILAGKKSALSAMQGRLDQKNPLQRLQSHQDKCEYLGAKLAHAIADRLRSAGHKLERNRHVLQTISPQATLDRGYAIVTRLDNDTIIRNAAEISAGEGIHARVARGAFQAKVTQTIHDK